MVIRKPDLPTRPSHWLPNSFFNWHVLPVLQSMRGASDRSSMPNMSYGVAYLPNPNTLIKSTLVVQFNW